MKNLRKIGKSFRYTVLFIVIINILFIGGVWIYSTYNYFNKESEKIKQEYTLKEKMRVKDAVNNVIESIEYHKSETEKILDKRIKERTYEAHDMAMVIYEKYKGEKSDEEIEKLIKETLEAIRFNDGRGYYFGGNINKGKLLFTSNPDYVGEMVLDYRSPNGKYIFREMVDLVKEKGEGFYEYMWAKPGNRGYTHRKKSFLKLFKPLNLWIGTGAYFKDVEEDIKKDILNEITHRSPDNGKYIFIELNSKYVKLNNKKMWIAFVRDITERKKMEEKLMELSITDGLTGLSNRRHLLNQLEVKLKEVNVEKPLCIFMIDIDHFKRVNDSLGHSAGDEVLKEFARILTKNLRKTDLIGRYGGEEFLVVLPDTSLEEVEKLMEKIRLNVYNSSWKYPELRVSFSGGLLEVNDPKNISLENIVIKVDELLYKAKEGGRNKIEIDTQ